MQNLIIGKGFLGEKLVSLLQKNSQEVVATAKEKRPDTVQLDITSPAQVKALFEKLKPESVFLLASMGSVDKCEVNSSQAMAVNYAAVKNVASFCGKHGSRLFFMSSDYVFNGEKGDYLEEDRKSPINVYGLTKDLAERELFTLPGSVIVRSSSFYGFNQGQESKGFPMHVIDALSNEKEFIALHQTTSPILIDDLAAALILLSKTSFSGTIHIAGPEPISRYESARLTATTFGLDSSLLMECEDQAELKLPAKRPKDSSLNVEKAESLGIKARKFKDGLREMKKQMEAIK